MTRDVPFDAAQGKIVSGWRSGGDGLFIRIRGESEDVRLICGCGRSHWLVREQFSGGVPVLSVTCHGCGTRGTFRMEAVRLRTP